MSHFDTVSGASVSRHGTTIVERAMPLNRLLFRSLSAISFVLFVPSWLFLSPVKPSPLFSAILLGLFVVSIRADDFKPEPGFISLFNGKDLTGWGYSATENFDGKTEASDGRYTAKDGMLVVHPQKRSEERRVGKE